MTEKGVTRMRYRGGIASEAKAKGKSFGYADGGTIIWKIEVLVAVNTS
jgi:hypothetical protein